MLYNNIEWEGFDLHAVIEYILKYLQLLRISDFVDIALVSVIIYYLIKLLRETRAMQLVKGIVFIFVIFLISRWLNLNALNYILGGAVQVGMFALVVIFQPELRNILERVGRFKFGKIIDLAADTSENDITGMIESVVLAACHMSASKTGALIVVERETKLGDVIATGTFMDASVSSGLLENIFVPNTPLHDGAVIIRRRRIVAAGCLLPLTSNNNLSRELGTRHRAAIGLSESTDAVVIVVSEETGRISIAMNGSIMRSLSEESLRKALEKTLFSAETSQTIDKIRFWRSK